MSNAEEVVSSTLATLSKLKGWVVLKSPKFDVVTSFESAKYNPNEGSELNI